MNFLSDYHVGCDSAWSSIYSFSAMPDGSDWSPRFAIFGDMGNENGRSIGRLQELAQKGSIDAIIHVGKLFCLCSVSVNFLYRTFLVQPLQRKLFYQDNVLDSLLSHSMNSQLT